MSEAPSAPAITTAAAVTASITANTRSAFHAMALAGLGRASGVGGRTAVLSRRDATGSAGTSSPSGRGSAGTTGRDRGTRAGAGRIGSPNGNAAGVRAAERSTTLSGGAAAGPDGGPAVGAGAGEGAGIRSATIAFVACTSRRSCSTQREQLRR